MVVAFQSLIGTDSTVYGYGCDELKNNVTGCGVGSVGWETIVIISFEHCGEARSGLVLTLISTFTKLRLTDARGSLL